MGTMVMETIVVETMVVEMMAEMNKILYQKYIQLQSFIRV